MDTRENNKFVLVFISDVEEKLQLTIARANTNLTGPQVADAMEAMIVNGSVVTKAGKPVLVDSANLVHTSIENFMA